MSSTITNNLGKEKIQQLLAAVGARPQKDAQQDIETTHYNWNEPHYFNSSQLTKLTDFTNRTAEAIAEKLGALYHNELDVKTTATTQHFAEAFLKQTLDDKQNNYYVAFGTEPSNPCGFISIPPQSAILWTKQMLGDTESSEDSDKDLSALEKSLLLDIASVQLKIS